MTTSQQPRVAIIGGGISGLSAAFRLKELSEEQNIPLHVELFEAEHKHGGVFGTIDESGYRVDIGADMFITNRPIGIDFAKRLGLESRLISPDKTFQRSFILRNGKPVPTPPGFNLMVPERVWPMLKSPLLSWPGKLRAGWEYFVPRKQNDQEESLGQFVRRRFGKEAFERLVQPLVGGIYTADPERLSLKATLPRFLEMEQRHGSLIRAARQRKTNQNGKPNGVSGVRYGLFVGFPNGMSELQDAYFTAIQDWAALNFAMPVLGIEKKDGKYAIHTETKSEVFDGVLCCVPAHVSSRLLANVDEGLSACLSEIPYASAAIVVSGHRLADIEHPMDGFGLVIPHVERRRILAVSFASRKFPGRAPEGCILLRTFVGGALQPELLEHNDDELIAIVQEELRDIFGMRAAPQFAEVVRWNNAMPQYHVGHLDRVARIEALMNEHAGLGVAGNGFRGVGIPDVIEYAENSVERVFAQLTVQETATTS